MLNCTARIDGIKGRSIVVVVPLSSYDICCQAFTFTCLATSFCCSLNKKNTKTKTCCPDAKNQVSLDVSERFAADTCFAQFQVCY